MYTLISSIRISNEVKVSMKKKIISLGMILIIGIMMLTGCKIRNYDSALIDINSGEDKITLGYANFIFKYNQARYDISYGDTYGVKMWNEDMTGTGSTFADEVKNNIVETLETQYVIKKHADEYNVTLTDDDKSKIDEVVKKFMDENTSSALNAMGADEDVVNKMITDMVYVSKMEKAMADKGRANGEINDTTNSSTYVSNLIDTWKNEVEFSVDDKLMEQIKVDDLFKADGSKSSNSTNTTNNTKGN